MEDDGPRRRLEGSKSVEKMAVGLDEMSKNKM